MSEEVQENHPLFNFSKIFFKSILFFIFCVILPYIFFQGVVGGVYPAFKAHIFAKAGLILFLVIIVAVYFSPKIYTRQRRDILPFEKFFFTKKLWLLFGLLLVFWVIGFVFIILGFKTTSYNVALPSGRDPVQLLLFGLVYCLVAPVAEEMLCRGLFYADFKRYFSDYVAIPASALVFALMHGFDPFKLTMMMLAGCLFGFARAITGGLFAPILLHIVNNIFAFTLIILAIK